jgi:hypothetical protein
VAKREECSVGFAVYAFYLDILAALDFQFLLLARIFQPFRRVRAKLNRNFMPLLSDRNNGSVILFQYKGEMNQSWKLRWMLIARNVLLVLGMKTRSRYLPLDQGTIFAISVLRSAYRSFPNSRRIPKIFVCRKYKGFNCENRIGLALAYGEVREMKNQTHFVIFKSDSRYSITECDGFCVKQAFMNEGIVSGDSSVIIRLSDIVPMNEKLESFVEKNAGRLIYI